MIRADRSTVLTVCGLVGVLIGGCANNQSVLSPQGPASAQIAVLTWVLFGFGTVVLFIVLTAAWLAIYGSARIRQRLSGSAAVIAGGIAFPAITLTALLAYGIWLTHANTAGLRAAGAMSIEIVGEQWWWRIYYIHNGQRVSAANELRIPAGRPVVFDLKTADVIHSFWVPNLGGKVDMIPGRTIQLALQADRPGIFRGQCAEYCGGPHALMAFEVVALQPQDFDVWLAGQGAVAVEPAGAQAQRGKDLFLRGGCGACHAVRGTEARGEVGPDLTHVASRRSVGIDTLPLTVDNLKRFISDGQHIKPGNRMPQFRIFNSDDLEAVAVYLSELR